MGQVGVRIGVDYVAMGLLATVKSPQKVLYSGRLSSYLDMFCSRTPPNLSQSRQLEFDSQLVFSAKLRCHIVPFAYLQY